MPSIYQTMTVDDAAAKLNVRVEEIYKLIRSRRIRAVKDGRKWKVDADSVLSRLRDRVQRRGHVS